ncbi:GumC family protein [Pseudoxanthomonas wuyuanensis]|uniref:GumC protein n=1 Tax=Pseudoxanthomonas wuyuanensis TaxID=1073196 RepID=A0A286D779_9GAMM|nr:GumC family protein [Pseudoxanthomonas wuyuanensis]KAF1721063.1 polysaccharide biosynthesis protein GumC [Pseudoxanthomonas wuyuanensis]SOD54506.1 GumC protein [Pseudoxanthomonas wuyuanensis]
MSTTYSREPGTAPHGDHAAQPGLYDYWYAIRGQWWIVIGITLLAVGLALLATLLITPTFRATTTLQIERDAMKVVNLEGLMPTESPNDRDFYQTQYELLQSRSLARRVIREAELARHPAFKDIADKAASRAKRNADGPDGSPTVQEAVELALTAPVLAGLEIEPVRSSRLVRVHYASADPELSAKVANAYAKAFIASNLERRVDASSFAVKYLSERLAEIRGRVEQSEKQLVEFSGEERIVSLGEGLPSLPAQNLSELNALLASAQQARIQAEAGWRLARTGDGLGLPQVLSSPLVQNLRTEQAKLASEYQQKLPTFKPDYPEMQRLNSQIFERQRQIAAEVANIREAIRKEYETARLQEELIVSSIDRLKSEELDLQNRSIRYNMLKREVDTNRQLYDGLLQRFKEIGVVGDVGSNNVTIVDTADVSGRPHSPRLALNLALAAVFGVFFGLVVALVRYFLREPRRPSA